MAAPNQGRDRPPSEDLGMTDAQIDNMEWENFVLGGALVLSSYRDRFEFYPAAGYPGTGTLQDNVPFDLAERRINIPQRREAWPFRYTPDGEEYDGRMFTRVQEGK